MGFNARLYLADRERLLEEPVKGTRRTKWHQDQHEVHTVLVLPPPDGRTEEEIEEQEDEWLRINGVI